MPGFPVFPQVSFAAFLADDGQPSKNAQWAVRAKFGRKIADFRPSAPMQRAPDVEPLVLFPAPLAPCSDSGERTASSLRNRYGPPDMPGCTDQEWLPTASGRCDERCTGRIRGASRACKSWYVAASGSIAPCVRWQWEPKKPTAIRRVAGPEPHTLVAIGVSRVSRLPSFRVGHRSCHPGNAPIEAGSTLRILQRHE